MTAKLVNIRPVGNNSVSVSLPNGATIHSTHVGLLPNNKLPPSARLVHMFPGLNKVLLSLGQFCDAGMKIIITEDKLLAVVDDDSQEVILQGSRSTVDGMWYINLSADGDVSQWSSKNNMSPRSSHNNNDSLVVNNSSPSFHPKNISQANSAYELTKKKDIAEFLSASMWNPVPETWIAAIDAGFFATWPGLTSTLIKKHLTKRIETSLGHMRADRSNVRSTKQKIVDMTTDSSNIKISNPVRANAFYVKTVELTEKLHADQTGHFPVTSSKGNKHLLIAYDWDSNAILVHPLKSKSAAEHL